MEVYKYNGKPTSLEITAENNTALESDMVPKRNIRFWGKDVALSQK